MTLVFRSTSCSNICVCRNHLQSKKEQLLRIIRKELLLFWQL